jgi:hypothetical protein
VERCTVDIKATARKLLRKYVSSAKEAKVPKGQTKKSNRPKHKGGRYKFGVRGKKVRNE